MADPNAIWVGRLPALLAFVDIESGQQERGTCIAKSGVQSSAAPHCHVGSQKFGVGVTENWLNHQPAVWAVFQDGGDREREYHGSVMLAR